MAKIAVVVAHPTYEDLRAGSLLTGARGRLLDDILSEAGLRRSDIEVFSVVSERPPRDTFAALRSHAISSGIQKLHRDLRRAAPKVIVALGAEAAHALDTEWPDARDGVHTGNIRKARDIENRRGYVFDSPFGPVLATISLELVSSVWTPWRVLIATDFRKAKGISINGCVRPARNVTIVGSHRECRSAVEALGRFRCVAADIETWGDTSLACVGFAGSSGQAYVFPARYLDGAREVLSRKDLTTVWANGIYDLFVLRHRYDVEFGGRVDDAQIAWHAAYPELAGQKEDKRKHRFTRKSLSFLASLTTTDRWWKGDYETDEEFFIYNGKDCCITLDVWEYVKKELDSTNSWATYELERGLMWPCVDMLQRGLRVDEDLRTSRVSSLETSLEDVNAEVAKVVLPFLEREWERIEDLGVAHLFTEIEKTCECCGHGTKKQTSCWACAGFDSSPSKAEMVEKWGEELTAGKKKAELEAELLPVCHVCGGLPRKETKVFNLNSDTQMKILLYDLLRLPKKFNNGALTVNENALKTLIGGIAE